MNSNPGAIIIDNGTGMIKAGFASDDIPRAVFPPKVGASPPKGSVMVGAEKRDVLIGDEAKPPFNILGPSNQALVKGEIFNWDSLEKIWQHVFYNELHIDSSEQAVLLTESISNPSASRERMVEIMFGTHNCSQVLLAPSPVLGVFGAGLLTALSVDCGEGKSVVVPVFDGYPERVNVERLEVSGVDITKHLAWLLNQRGFSFYTRNELEAVNLMKERNARAYSCPSAESKAETSDAQYQLPDGTSVSLGSTVYECCEPLFSTSKGIPQAISGVLNKYQDTQHADLKSNVVACGGTTVIPGFHTRLKRELGFHVEEYAGGEYLPWLGGSVLAKCAKELWITKSEYQESGPTAIHLKCNI